MEKINVAKDKDNKANNTVEFSESANSKNDPSDKATTKWVASNPAPQKPKPSSSDGEKDA